MSDAWSGMSVLGENPQDPLGRISPGRATLVSQMNEPVLLIGVSGSANILQREDAITGFDIPQGVVALLLYLNIVGAGGTGAQIRIYDTITSTIERGIAADAGGGGGAQVLIGASRGTVAWRADKGSSTSFSGGIYAVGWIRNP
jgi:hypothetical protein